MVASLEVWVEDSLAAAGSLEVVSLEVAAKGEGAGVRISTSVRLILDKVNLVTLRTSLLLWF